MIYREGNYVQFVKTKLVRYTSGARGFRVEREKDVGLVVERMKFGTEYVDRYKILSSDGKIHDIHVSYIRLWQGPDV